jgi:dihydrofolate synthase/folylpolyglutamate synthase
MKIKSLAQFETFLKTRIPMRADLFMGDIGLKRAKFFMKMLGNPQNKIKVIHIAGTSGKGSTAHLTSKILESQGFSVGLSISPHVFDIRERMQVLRSLPHRQTGAKESRTRTTCLDGRRANAGHANVLPGEKMVLKYFNQILPIILQMEKCKYGMPTFFEINVGLAFFMFAKEKLDYAVIETGLGGTLDATNTVSSKNKICIITKIGLDHTEILGKTISKIASEKAGVIQKQNTVICHKCSHRSSVISHQVIEKYCKQKSAKLHTINKNNFSISSSTDQETVFDFFLSLKCHPELVSGSINANVMPIEIPKQVRNDNEITTIKNIHLGLIGIHQAENCSLALACLAILSKRDKFSIDEVNLRKALREIKITGRMEILKIKKRTIIVDGAHNPQKMEALIRSLEKIYPKQKFTFLVAFKKGKDFQAMLERIIPLTDKIILTQFSTTGMDNHWSSIDNEEISTFLKSKNFKNISIIKNKHSDILQNIGMSKRPIVVTGSLYLISSIYNYLN